jgi:hypothetical protein
MSTIMRCGTSPRRRYPGETPRENLSRFAVFRRHYTRIRASDSPKWRWANEQCRQWIFSVLIDYCGQNLESAFEQAEQFRGCGPNLFFETLEGWRERLYYDGDVIYYVLVEAREQEVPKCVSNPPWMPV